MSGVIKAWVNLFKVYVIRQSLREKSYLNLANEMYISFSYAQKVWRKIESIIRKI